MATLPKSRYEAELARTRAALADDEQLKKLEAATRDLEREMQGRYPRLHLSNEQILASQRAARAKHKDEPEFKALIKQTADAVRAEREYVLEKEPRLLELLEEASN